MGSVTGHLRLSCEIRGHERAECEAPEGAGSENAKLKRYWQINTGFGGAEALGRKC